MLPVLVITAGSSATHGLATAFSFYATKNMTTGEGGMITTNDAAFADHVRRLSLHGMNRDAWKRYGETGTWYYEVTEAGFKCNMMDMQAAIGIHQLKKLESFNERRRDIAARYNDAFSNFPELRLPEEIAGRNHTYHLYAVQIRKEATTLDRETFIAALKKARIGTSVHFIPVHRHPYYSQNLGYTPAMFPVAERRYHGSCFSPVLSAGCRSRDVQDVIEAVSSVIRDVSRRNQNLLNRHLTLACTHKRKYFGESKGLIKNMLDAIRRTSFRSSYGRILTDFLVIHVCLLVALAAAVTSYTVMGRTDTARIIAEYFPRYYGTFFWPLSLVVPIVFLLSGVYERSGVYTLQYRVRTILRGAGLSILLFLAANYLMFRNDMVSRSVVIWFSISLLTVE